VREVKVDEDFWVVDYPDDDDTENAIQAHTHTRTGPAGRLRARRLTRHARPQIRRGQEQMLILCDNAEDKKAWLSKLKLAMEERKKGDAQGPPPSAMDQVRAHATRAERCGRAPTLLVRWSSSRFPARSRAAACVRIRCR
jgi:hypothetical protein